MNDIPIEYVLVSDLTEAQKAETIYSERYYLNKEVYGTVPQRGFWECILANEINYF